MVTVRTGQPADRPVVMTILDAAMLETDSDRIRAALSGRSPAATVLVAERAGRILGAIVLDGHRIDAIAVRRRSRNRGIGRALVRNAASRRGELTATFDRAVLPFYRSLGFAIEGIDGDRFRGRGPIPRGSHGGPDQ